MAIEPRTPQEHVWHREFPIASTLLVAGSEDAFEDSIVPQESTLVEGDWVTLNTSDEAILAATPTYLAWLVWTGGTRKDLRSSLKVTVFGGPFPFVLSTDRYNATNIVAGTARGTALTTRAGVLDLAAATEQIVAILEKPVYTKAGKTWIDVSLERAGRAA